MAKVNDGTVQICASEWPSFLYSDDAPFDPEDEEVGLFRGYLLLRVSLSSSSTFIYKHTF
jgi:hypothetical protein